MNIRAQRILGSLTLVLSLGYCYLLYPLPNERILDITRDKVQSQIEKQRDGAKNHVPIGAQDSLELSALAQSLWVGWWLGLLIVLMGVVASVATIWTRSPLWRIGLLAFCVVFIFIYWSQVILPLGKTFLGFVEFKLDTLGSLRRIGAYWRLGMELHQAVSAIVFHVMAVYLLSTSFTTRGGIRMPGS